MVTYGSSEIGEGKNAVAARFGFIVGKKSTLFEIASGTSALAERDTLRAAIMSSSVLFIVSIPPDMGVVSG